MRDIIGGIAGVLIIWFFIGCVVLIGLVIYVNHAYPLIGTYTFYNATRFSNWNTTKIQTMVCKKFNATPTDILPTPSFSSEVINVGIVIASLPTLAFVYTIYYLMGNTSSSTNCLCTNATMQFQVKVIGTS